MERGDRKRMEIKTPAQNGFHVYMAPGNVCHVCTDPTSMKMLFGYLLTYAENDVAANDPNFRQVHKMAFDILANLREL